MTMGKPRARHLAGFSLAPGLAAMMAVAGIAGARAQPAGDAPPATVGRDRPAEKPDEAVYRSDVARWQAGDPAIDLRDLRMRHAALHGSRPVAARDAKAIEQAVAAKDWRGLSMIADGLIAADPLDLEAHYLAELAHGQAADEAGRTREHGIVLALLRSITRGVSGRSEADCWEAMNVAEEYAALGLLGFTQVSQALRTQDGHAYDVMTVKPRGSEAPVEIWFRIDWFFGRN
jgi:hypothetical protein